MHHADEYMAAIAAERVVRHLERAGFVVMKKPPIVGGAALGRGSKASGPNLTLGAPPDGAARTRGIDPLLPFEIRPMNGR